MTTVHWHAFELRHRAVVVFVSLWLILAHASPLLLFSFLHNFFSQLSLSAGFGYPINNLTFKISNTGNMTGNGPGPLNITFGSDMLITLFHLILMSKIYVVNSDMKNVTGMSDPNVMFKGPGPLMKL